MSLPLHAIGATLSSASLLTQTGRARDEDDAETAYVQLDPSSRQRHEYTTDKHSTYIKIPYRQIFYVLLAVAGTTALGFAAIGSVVGWKKYTRFTRPHRAIHASSATAKDGSRVVRPYFAPAKYAGIDRASLVVKVWFREGVPLPPEPVYSGEERWSHRIRDPYSTKLMGEIGESGFVVDEEGETKEWQEVWTTEMEDLGIEETRKRILPVTLPGRIVHSLVTNNRSRLISTFALVPSTPANNRSPSTHTSSRPVTKYGPSSPWPLAWTSPSSSSSALDAFVAHSSAGTDLLESQEDWRRQTQQDGSILVYDRVEETFQPLIVNFLATRTWVTMASDYSIYGLESFKNAMESLKSWKDSCFRSFARDGHFENLLQEQSSSSSSASEWKYGPFLTTRMSANGPKDFVRLPTAGELKGLAPSQVKDFTYNWDVTYSPASPAKLTYIKRLWDRPYDLMNQDESQNAQRQDNAELHSALMGHSFNPNSRPLARGAIGYIAKGLRYLAVPFVLHYWFTRRTSTGIAILTLTLQTIIDLTYHIVQTALNSTGFSVFFFVITIISFLLLIVKQIHLCFRFDWEFGKVKLPGFKFEREVDGIMLSKAEGPEVWAPTGVRMERASAAEKESHSLDAKFDWRLRILIFALTFVILRFAPSPPAIISAQKYRDIMQGFGGLQHYNETVLKVLHIINAFQSSVWFVSRLSQLHLNHRSQTFAGSYGVTSYLLFGSLLLSHITTIFVKWFGRPHIMQPFTIWDVVTLLVQGGMCVQAARSKRVDQYEAR